MASDTSVEKDAAKVVEEAERVAEKVTDDAAKVAGLATEEAVRVAAKAAQEAGNAARAVVTITALLENIHEGIKRSPTIEMVREQWSKQDAFQKEVLANSKLDEESRQLMKIHIGDMADLRRIQKDSNEKTEQLSNAQDRLADALEHINQSLTNGFVLGNAVVRLFGKITFVFLAAVVVLSLVIIWIAKLDASHEDGKGNKTSIGRRAEVQELPLPPTVDFTVKP